MGYIAWSHDEKKLCYVAEEKSVAAQSHFSDARDASSVDGSSATAKANDEEPIGREYDAVFDFGEAHAGRANGRLFVVDLNSDGAVKATRQVAINHALLAGLSLGAPSFGSDGKLAFVGWPVAPRRLGLAHCFNRRSRCFVATLGADAAADRVALVSGDDELGARSPRLCRNGDVVYLAVRDANAHSSCSLLRRAAFDGAGAWRASTTVVDVVLQPTSDDVANPMSFPGLYVAALPLYPFIRLLQLGFCCCSIVHIIHFKLLVTLKL